MVETVRFLPELLYDAEGAFRGGGALGGGDGEDRGDRFEGVVEWSASQIKPDFIL